MQSPWKRVNIIDSGVIGRKIVEWTLDSHTRPDQNSPKGFEEFKRQLQEGLEIIDSKITGFPEIVGFELVETPINKIVIRLPPKEMIEKAIEKYTDPSFKVEDYPLPSYLSKYSSIDLQKLTGITPEELFYSSVGSYTTAECE